MLSSAQEKYLRQIAESLQRIADALEAERRCGIPMVADSVPSAIEAAPAEPVVPEPEAPKGRGK
jgi:hypothetical protein